MNGSKYYYAKSPESSPTGPVSLDELHEIANKGEISADTPVIAEGANNWGRYRDLKTGERTREMAEVVIDRAARMAASLNRQESRSVGLGFLLGIVHIALLPARIIGASFRAISDWGTARFIGVGDENLASASLGRVVTPMWILAFTAYWVGDCLAIIIIGKPVVSFWLFSGVFSFFMMGTPLHGSNSAFFSQMLGDTFLISNIGDRLLIALKSFLWGYFSTIVWKLIGEIYCVLATFLATSKSSVAHKAI